MDEEKNQPDEFKTRLITDPRELCTCISIFKSLDDDEYMRNEPYDYDESSDDEVQGKKNTLIFRFEINVTPISYIDLNY